MASRNAGTTGARTEKEPLAHTSEGQGCPKCGAPTEMGFGLAGGGYGPYAYCSDDACDYFEKWQEGGA
jgi:hypothetical protein